MATFRGKDIRASLLKKGFEEQESHHHQFYLIVNGKRSSVSTYISHGNIEYGDALLSQVKKQMCLDKRQLEDFINCPLSEEAYRAILIEKNAIPAPPSEPQE